nr:MAG TPA: hypothetical protein [Caudoviricetes sp.]
MIVPDWVKTRQVLLKCASQQLGRIKGALKGCIM